MRFLLHRDTCIASVRNLPLVAGRFRQHRGALHVSAITVMEAEVWLLGPTARAKHLQAYGAMMRTVAVLPVDEVVAHRAALLASSVRTRGGSRMTTPNVLVAATALIQGMTLVTHATPAFVAVPGLVLADWMVP
jgi:predicted nucleic acid-binding protein